MNIAKSNQISYIFQNALLFVLVLIPVTLLIPGNAINSITIITALGLTGLNLVIFKEKLELGNNIFMVLIIVFFLLHVALLIKTEDFESALSVLQRKLPIMILPIIVFLNRKLLRRHIKLIMIVFLAAVFLAALWCQYYVVLEWRESGKNSLELFTYYKFLSSYLSEKIDLHPSYFSNLVLLALLMIHYLLAQLKNKPYKVVLLLLWGYFSFLIMQLGSRIHILNYVLFFGWILISSFLKKNKKGYKSIVPIFLIGFIVFLFLFKSGFIKNRFEQGIDMYFNDGKNYPSYYESSRIHVWKHFPSEFLKAPLFGAGTGNENNNLYQNFLSDSYKRGIERKLNYHNQYLQELTRLGIVGFLILGMVIYIMFKKSIILKASILFWFLFFNCTFFMVESVLERQNGIVFFFFFGPLLYYGLEKEIKKFKIQENSNLN